MENAGFRIMEVSIEGFKGFTIKQSLPIEGKHLFLLGPNGYGKSSVLEAIRWGLFGSTRRRDEIVLNQNYTGTCRVELSLEEGGKKYRLRRTLLRGVTGGNDAILLDESGQEQNLREVMPQLDSAAAGEAMHLVFTAQAVKQRRSTEDLEPFERNLYSYLGLTDIRLAIGRLDKFLLVQDGVLNNLGEKLSEAEHELNSDIAGIEDARDAILANPPWGDEPTPTLEQTRLKTLNFCKEVALLVGAVEPPESGVVDTLYHMIEEYVAQATSLGKAAIAQHLSQVETKLGRVQGSLQKWHVSSSNCEENRTILAARKISLLDILGNNTIEEFKLDLDAANNKLETAATNESLKHFAAILLSGPKAEGQPVVCPVCRRPLEQDSMLKLQQELDESASESIAKLTSEIDRLKSILEQIQSLQATILIQENKVQSCENNLSQQMKALALELQVEEGADLEVEAAKQEEALVNQTETLKRQLEDAKEADRVRRSTLGKLQEEIKLHRLVKQHRELQPRQAELKRAQENLSKLMALRETTFVIHKAMENGLLAELKSSLGPVNNALSESFVALTQHPAYDRAFVDPDILPKLVLKVGSTSDLQGKWDESVLNGQAASALGLVPFFSFSRLTDMPFEVHVMLLDDPTQSFDRAHIEKLVEKLAQVGQKVQLVLSSHELMLFKEFIPRYFPETSHKIVELTKFTIKSGPVI
jgi:hypothetical protein